MRERIVFITGVSSGIGAALSRHYLNLGWHVYGLSRRQPDTALLQAGLHHQQVDISDHELLTARVSDLISELDRIDLCVLNAGQHGGFADLAEQSLESIRKLFNVNVWANKLIIDQLFASGRSVKQVVGISSGASVNGNRGWGAYSLTKATLNMLICLYAHEFPECHFSAFAPGLVDTEIQEYLCSLPDDPRFPTLETMRAKRGTEQMPMPDTAAPRLASAIAAIPTTVESGAFCDIRQSAFQSLESS